MIGLRGGRWEQGAPGDAGASAGEGAGGGTAVASLPAIAASLTPAAGVAPVAPSGTADDDHEDRRLGEAGELRELLAREKSLLHAERHRIAIRLRYVFLAIALLLAVEDFVYDTFPAPWELVLALPLGLIVVNGLCDWIARRGRAAAWHFWGVVALETVVIAGTSALIGEAGYLAIPFILMAASSYALGLPRLARVQLGIGAALYPLARWAGYALVLDTTAPYALIATETACLAALGYLGLRAPIRFTYRVRAARRALLALERGDFGVRLSTRTLDDLGFLAVSFNTTAMAVGRMVRALTQEVAEREKIEAQLTHQAFHDALTGLANRVLFRDRVIHALARAGRQAERVTVLFIDLDGFKTVNDSLGHATGDRLLVAVAERLLNATRGCDTVARLGGDEFAILLENVRNNDDAIRVAERVGTSLATPFVIDDAELAVGGSIGIARANLDDEAAEPGDRADALLRDADVAMYRAKADGKGRYAFFEPHMHEVALERLELEGELRQALQRHEFRLVYQPVVQLDGGRITGVEALARWESPRRGLVPPDVFIPIAEETGLIIALGRWVLHEACRQGAAWQDAGDDGVPLTMSVNVSPRQLQHAGFVDDVRLALAESGLRPEALFVEITESALVQDTAAVVERLHELKRLGVRLAIDDFGTGYSSLGYLKRLPVDVLKIDKTFIDGVGRGRQDTALARTIVGLGATLALRCVAEGIEHSQQQSHLRALGCELGQGYLFAKPLEAGAIDALLMERAAI